ncbi:hypothetical protein Asp14428_45310 [Actinoplanes sp. NBRC 14428]|nr:hypothetical protein Asp14428_45310 [Actinoplanes sp. NBRC 14428]
MSATILHAALELAEQGLPVFLLGRAKRPVANCPACPKRDRDRRQHDPQACGHLTCHGFYAATCDADRIRAMHDAVPGGLLAIRTGAASGLAVVDIDPRNGGRLIPELMPPTRCTATGDGGWHLHYRHPGIPLAKDLNHRGHPGIDIKADGGYVVAPPSIHPGTRRPYRWVGDRPVIEMAPPLIAACKPPEAAPAVSRLTSPTPTTIGGAISSPDALLAAHLRAVDRAPAGRRRRTLYGAARGVARMVAAGAITPQAGYAALYEAGLRAEQTPPRSTLPSRVASPRNLLRCKGLRRDRRPWAAAAARHPPARMAEQSRRAAVRLRHPAAGLQNPAPGEHAVGL